MRLALFALALVAVAALLAGCSVGHTRQQPHPQPQPSTVLGWRAVLKDWYDDGKFDQRHPCAAVREAMKHLPVDGPIYSTAFRDLQRYARRVC